MAIPPRRWVGYALLVAGGFLLFDTLTFFQTNWSPLKVPMYAADELGIGCLLFTTLIGAIGAALLVSGIVENKNRKRAEQTVWLTSPGPIPAGFRWETEPATKKSHPERNPLFRPRILIGLGLAILGIASFATINRWIDTRIFVPADTPVSLAAGHIRTGPFRINVEQGYSIWIDFDQSTYFNPMCSSYSVLKSTWALYRDGRVYTQWEAPVLQDGYLEGFDATKGFYDLDVHVLADASCLNANRPRLRVVTSRDNDSFYAGVLLWSGAIFVVVGISLVVLGWRRGVFREPEQSASVTNEPTVGQNFQWAQKLPLRRPIVGIPAFGLLAGMVFAILAILMMMLTGAFQRMPIGLWVYVLKPGAVPAKPDSWIEPVLVLVTDAGPGQEPGLSINSKVVAWDDLAGALKHELSGQREWTVYVCHRSSENVVF